MRSFDPLDEPDDPGAGPAVVEDQHGVARNSGSVAEREAAHRRIEAVEEVPHRHEVVRAAGDPVGLGEIHQFELRTGKAAACAAKEARGEVEPGDPMTASGQGGGERPRAGRHVEDGPSGIEVERIKSCPVLGEQVTIDVDERGRDDVERQADLSPLFERLGVVEDAGLIRAAGTPPGR